MLAFQATEASRMRQVTMSAKGQRLLSRTVLAELETQIGAEALTQALELLVTDLRSSAEILARCLDSGDEARARRMGHKLKGILEQYGIRDPGMAASNLASRYDLYWVTECTALFSLCQAATDETRKVQLARAASNDDMSRRTVRSVI
jgi:hypothetical protein